MDIGYRERGGGSNSATQGQGTFVSPHSGGRTPLQWSQKPNSPDKSGSHRLSLPLTKLTGR